MLHGLFSNCGEQGLPSSCSAQASHCGGFSCYGAQASVVQHVGSAVMVPRLWSTGSVVVVHEISCSSVYGIFLDQGLNPCPLHWQADSLPLSHLGSPSISGSLNTCSACLSPPECCPQSQDPLINTVWPARCLLHNILSIKISYANHFHIPS